MEAAGNCQTERPHTHKQGGDGYSRWVWAELPQDRCNKPAPEDTSCSVGSSSAAWSPLCTASPRRHQNTMAVLISERFRLCHVASIKVPVRKSLFYPLIKNILKILSSQAPENLLLLKFLHGSSENMDTQGDRTAYPSDWTPAATGQ